MPINCKSFPTGRGRFHVDSFHTFLQINKSTVQLRAVLPGTVHCLQDASFFSQKHPWTPPWYKYMRTWRRRVPFPSVRPWPLAHAPSLPFVFVFLWSRHHLRRGTNDTVRRTYECAAAACLRPSRVLLRTATLWPCRRVTRLPVVYLRQNRGIRMGPWPFGALARCQFGSLTY